MEVEARMKRNYLPPSIQGGYYPPAGYQSPPPAPLPAQGSTGAPNYAKNCMKPVLETIPQGSIMGSAAQAVTPYTPSMSQYSPTHGAVASQTGSIVSGTPVGQNSAAMAANQNFSASTSTHAGSIISGTPVPGQGFQKQGSIVTGTPVHGQPMSSAAQNQGSSTGTPQGSILSGTPMQIQGYMVPQNSGSIMSGTPVQNQGSIMTGVVQNQGSIMSGTPVQSQNFSSNQGSIVSGTPISSQGSIVAGTPMSVDPKSFPNYGVYNPSFPGGYQGPGGSAGAPGGSITAGTPLAGQYTRQRKYSGPQRVKLQMLATVQEMGNSI